MEKILNTRPGYFPIKSLNEMKLVPVSDNFREQYEKYIFKKFFINGILIKKEKQDDHYLLLIKDTGITKKSNDRDICREDHVWIMCDANIGEKVSVGEKYEFYGQLRPYISKNKINIGFKMFFIVTT